MSNERKQPGILFSATVLTIVIFGAYVTAYLAMVKPEAMGVSGVGPWEIPPDYTGRKGNRGQAFWSKVFAPAHAVDRKLRPDKWIFEYPPPRPPRPSARQPQGRIGGPTVE